ncbi:hypothetical protein J2T12_002292 [Paenibacillus anaericanus]|nr:hypothetical protein [Paenibacillus anaericanus]
MMTKSGIIFPCAVYKLQVSEGVFDKAKQEFERMMVDR